ncbi:hypothetical protein L1887_28981 [Cichorium endivia]|nr:hypothetical protein L1887_28981 [Cichorium endivia]
MVEAVNTKTESTRFSETIVADVEGFTKINDGIDNWQEEEMEDGGIRRRRLALEEIQRLEEGVAQQEERPKLPQSSIAPTDGCGKKTRDDDRSRRKRWGREERERGEDGEDEDRDGVAYAETGSSELVH